MHTRWAGAGVWGLLRTGDKDRRVGTGLEGGGGQGWKGGGEESQKRGGEKRGPEELNT